MHIFFLFLPIIISLLVLIKTKKSFISLFSGFFISILLQPNLTFFNFIFKGYKSISSIFYINNSFNKWNISILIFLPMLSILSTLMEESGGINSFSNWIKTKLKTKKSAELFIIFLGIIIYIDGYFNSIIVGNISKTLSESYSISKAKIAYYVDSTSAPICPLIPISSWGASILGIISSLLLHSKFKDVNPLNLFLTFIPYQFFTFSVLGVLFLVALFNFNIFKMKNYEKHLLENNIDKSKINKNTSKNLQEINPFIFLSGILSLFLLTILFSIINLSNLALNMTYSVTLSALIYFFIVRKYIDFSEFKKNLKINLINTFKSIFTLILAWAMINSIQTLGFNHEITTFLKANNISSSIFPILIFVFSMFISFSSGTSWGTFYLLIPIAFSIGEVYGLHEISIFIGATISGSVFGDNCSLISDTTIISALTCNCKLDAHYSTQIPYALIAGGISLLMWIILFISSSLFFSYFMLIISLSIIQLFFNKNSD